MLEDSSQEETTDFIGYQCNLCTPANVFESNTALRLHHHHAHIYIKEHVCGSCGHQFNQLQNLELHVAVRHATVAVQQHCPLATCGRVFRRATALRTHLEQHLINDDYQCQHCDMSFEYRMFYEQHMQQVHLVACDDGDVEQLLPETTQSLEHKVVKTQNVVRAISGHGKYGCSECNKRFHKPCLLQRHIVVHSSAKPFQCPLCSKYFSQKSSLQRHSQHHHDRQKPHACPKCNLCFAQKSNLLAHLQRTHPLNTAITTPFNSFACDLCACVFTKLNILNRHKKQQHTATCRAAQLEIAFQDETPVDDADELARNVLLELKKLQGSMLPNTTDAAMSEVVTSEIEIETVIRDATTVTPIANEPTSIVDAAATHLIRLCDRLNPAKETNIIEVQCIKRNDGITYYICEFCAKEFRKTYNLIRHRRTHSQETPYNCTYCSKQFTTKSKLSAHEKVHFSADNHAITKQYTCNICQSVFDSMRQLDAHASQHAATHTLNYVCSTCGRSFATLSAFSGHKHTPHDEELQMLCNLLPDPIDISSTAVDETSRKQRTSSKQRSFQCSFCSFQTQKRSHLLQHERRHTSQKAHKCGSCGRSFTTISSLNVHHKIHTAHKQYACSQCSEKTFSTASCLRRHLLLHHTPQPQQQRTFKCVYCTKCYKNKAHCRQHMKTHLKKLLNVAPTSTTIDTPSLSPSAASTSADAATAVISDNDIAKSCLLVMQPIVTAVKSAPPPTPKFVELQMLSHYRRNSKQHKNITVEAIPKSSVATTTTAKNICNICLKIFQKPHDLQRHRRTHTKERPYPCAHCSKSFALQSTLRDHQLTHAQSRAAASFSCQVCGKAYTSQKVLTLHLRIHTGERPFSCEYCAKTFRTSGHRKAHLKSAAHKPDVQ